MIQRDGLEPGARTRIFGRREADFEGGKIGSSSRAWLSKQLPHAADLERGA
jgi:hypothetical protein